MSLNGFFNSYIPLTNTTSLTATNVINAGSINVSKDLTLSYVDNNSILTTDSNKKVITKTLNDGQILIGKNNDEPQIKGITGTNKQVIITHNPNDITFGLPQDLDLDSTPTFNNLKLDGLTGPYLVATDNTNNLQSLTTSSNNGVISGITGSSLNIDTPQDLRTTSNPTFNNINVNNIDCASILSTGDIKSNTNVVGSQLVATSLTPNRLIGGATGGALQSLTTSSNNGVIVGLTGSNLIIDTPQDLQTTSSPTFSNLDITTNLTCGYVGGDLVPSAGLTYSLGRDNGGGSYRRWQFIYVGGLNCNSVWSNLNPYPNNTYSLGSTGSKWQNVYTTNLDVSNNLTCGYVGGDLVPSANLTYSLGRDNGGGSYRRWQFIYVGGLNCNTVSSNLTPFLNNWYDLGSSNYKWFNVYAKNLYTDSIAVADLSSNRLVGVGTGGDLQSLTATSSNGVSTTVSGTTLTIDTPQDLRTNSNPTFNDLNISGDLSCNRVKSSLIPSTTSTYDIGSTSNRWRRLYMANGNGIIYMGHGIRTANRAELHLHANGDDVSEIMFGTNDRTDSNVKWALSSRISSEGNDFRLMRGPALTGGAFETIFNVSGATGLWSFEKATDSSSTTNGSVTFKGGVGIAKKLNVGSLAINGTDVNLSNLVTTNTSQTITAVKTFTGETGTGTSIRNIQVGGQVNNCGIKFGGWVGSGVYYQLGPEYDTHRMHLRAHNFDVLTVRSDWNDQTHFKYIYANGHMHLSSPYAIRFLGRGDSDLNYYKEHSYSTYFTGGGGGSISANVNATIKCIRIGKNVTVDVLASTSNFLATGGNPYLVVNTPINEEFRPVSSHRFGTAIVNNNNTFFIQAMTEVNYAGYIYVAPAPNGYFVGGLGSSNNIRPFSLTYNIN